MDIHIGHINVQTVKVIKFRLFHLIFFHGAGRRQVLHPGGGEIADTSGTGADGKKNDAEDAERHCQQ